MPENRKQFERNMNLLAEMLEYGRISISQTSVHTIRGISRVRFGPNMRINLQTIDEMARLTANTVTQMSTMKHNNDINDE